VIELSILICTYRRDAVLCDTLRHLFEQARSDVEIIVVDQSPEHDAATRRFLDQAVQARRLRVIAVPEPSLTRARNLGARAASGRVLIYLDDDIIPAKDLVEAYRQAFRNGFTGAIAGQVLHEGQVPVKAPGSFSHNGVVEPFFQVYGANFGLLRETYFCIGGSDENLGVHTYVEDRILSDRLKQHGRIIRFEPSASVVHLLAARGGCRISDESQPTREWEKSFGHLYYLIHYRGCLSREAPRLFWSALRAGPLRKAVVKHPWRLVAAGSGFVQAWLRAARTCPQIPVPQG